MQFNEEASKSEEIRHAYEECWKFENCAIGQSQFENKQVQGTLRKKVDGFNMESYPARFYILDF
jgi:hypothetical protein